MTLENSSAPDAAVANTARGDRLRAENLKLGYGGVVVVPELDVSIPDGKVTAIVGANGCGKSTLLRALARLLKPSAGQVLLDGKDIHERGSKEVARTLGMLPQQPVVPDGLSVAELVARGRYPHHGIFRSWNKDDDAAVASALELTDTAALAARGVDELSGGQRQRVWIAMALAQQTPLLLLDEPTTYLDLAHQVDVLNLIDDLNAERGTTVVMVLHELNLAARYADHMIAMKDGRIAVQGAPQQVLTQASVKDVFGLEASVLGDPVSGAPMVVPHARRRGVITEVRVDDTVPDADANRAEETV